MGIPACVQVTEENRKAGEESGLFLAATGRGESGTGEGGLRASGGVRPRTVREGSWTRL